VIEALQCALSVRWWMPKWRVREVTVKCICGSMGHVGKGTIKRANKEYHFITFPTGMPYMLARLVNETVMPSSTVSPM